MIWLTLRQFRGQALTALAALAALTIYLLILGVAIRNSYDTTIVGCEATNSCSSAMTALEDQYSTQLVLSFALLIILPAIIGTFWGTPLIARELETGTHQLVWNQSVTRRRWLAIKLVVIGLFSVALTAALSLLITWAASPYDDLQGNRFAAIDFASRNIVPLGYAAFAFILGTTVGLIVRRTIPAMALTLAIFAAVQILVPNAIRPHLQPPVTDTVAFAGFDGLNISPDADTEVSIEPNTDEIPGAWILSGRSALLDTAGNPIAAEPLLAECPPTADLDQDEACFAALPEMYYQITYQPADRYWTFQWLELAAFLLLAALLAGVALWRIPRVHK